MLLNVYQRFLSQPVKCIPSINMNKIKHNIRKKYKCINEHQLMYGVQSWVNRKIPVALLFFSNRRFDRIVVLLKNSNLVIGNFGRIILYY